MIIIYLFTAFAIGFIMGYFFRQLTNWLSNTDADFESDIEVLDLLADSINSNGVDRALLLVTTNGGEEIKLGSQKYASVLLEPANSLQPYVKNDFQQYLLDDEYLRLIAKVKKEGVARVFTQSMHDSLLKRRYMADNIVAAIVFKIHSTSTRFYYAEFCTKDGQLMMMEKGTPYSIGIESKVNRMRNMF